MPRFFFHRMDGVKDIDADGTVLPDLETARMEAVRFAGETLHFAPHKLHEDESLKIEVSDATGLTLFTVLIVAIESPASSLADRNRDHNTSK